MSKKKTIVFVCIAVSILAIVIIAGLTIISPTLFSTKEDADDKDKPQIAENIEGLELIGSEEKLENKEDTSENNITSTSPSYNNVWEEMGLSSPTAGMEDIDESDIEDNNDYDGTFEIEEEQELTSSFVIISNPRWLANDTTIGTNGYMNLAECLEDYLDYYIGEAKEYTVIIDETFYEDSGNYRTFFVDIEHENGTWRIECNYVVTMNYYEFFCDDINPRPKTGED